MKLGMQMRASAREIPLCLPQPHRASQERKPLYSFLEYSPNMCKVTCQPSSPGGFLAQEDQPGSEDRKEAPAAPTTYPLGSFGTQGLGDGMLIPAPQMS
jgi:hypothetical protein